MLKSHPVRPPPVAHDNAGGDAATQAASTKKGYCEEEEEIDPKKALFDEPITGIETVLLDENGPGALDAKPLPTPPR